MTSDLLVFIGTYTEPILFGTGKTLQGKGEGIYAYGLDPSSGRLELFSKTPALQTRRTSPPTRRGPSSTR